jgi:hypothetical protein
MAAAAKTALSTTSMIANTVPNCRDEPISQNAVSNRPHQAQIFGIKSLLFPR